MKHDRPLEMLKKVKRLFASRKEWVWFAIGTVMLPFTAWQTVIPVAAWFAPLFLLRFSRTTARGWLGRLAISAAYMAAFTFASRGTPFNLLGLLGNIVVKGAAFSLPYVLDRMLARRLRGVVRALVFPSAYTAIDWLLSIVSLSNSGSIAYSQLPALALMQILSVTGMWGVTFLVTWFASTANQLWESDFRLRTLRVELGLYAAVFGCVLLYGAIRLAPDRTAEPGVATATVVGDTELVARATGSIDWLTVNRSPSENRASLRPAFAATVEQMFTRTETALRGGARVVAWQESGAWVLDEDRQQVIDQAARMARRGGAYLQVELEVVGRTGRLQCVENQSILIDPTGGVAWTYNKSRPVPFDEAFVTIPGNGRLPSVTSPFGRLGASICYDNYFPALIRQAGARHTDIMLSPFNDSRVFAPYFVAIAACRSIENGFSMVRPTGNGLSAIIDPFGRVRSEQSSFSGGSGIMLANAPTHGVTTLYARLGDVLPALCVGFLLACAGWLIRRSVRQAAARARS